MAKWLQFLAENLMLIGSIPAVRHGLSSLSSSKFRVEIDYDLFAQDIDKNVH